MNSNENNIRWNIDDINLYKDDKTGKVSGYDPDDTDCKSIEEAIDCLELLEEAINVLEQLIITEPIKLEAPSQKSIDNLEQKLEDSKKVFKN